MLEVVVMGVLALLTALLGVIRPTWFAGYAFVVLVFAKTLAHLSDDLLRAIDEVTILVGVAVLVVRRLALRRRLRWYPGLGWFAAFGLFGVTSGIVAGVSFDLLSVASFLALKGVLLGFALIQADWTRDSVRAAARVGAALIVVILVACVVNAAVPAEWTATFTRRGEPQLVAGIPALVGPFTHPGDLGLVLALAAIAVLAYRQVMGRGWLSLTLLVGSVVGSIASLRRKSVVGLAAAGAWILTRSRRLGAWFWVGAAALGALALGVAFGTGLVQSTFAIYVLLWDENPRLLITGGAAVVASEYFPLGAGFGRFGSFIAAENYSPEYVRLGLDVIDNTSPSSTYLTDTQWPAIVGEAGWIGGAFFAIGLVRMWLPLHRGWRAPGAGREERLVALVGMGWTIQLLIESIAAPVYVTSPSVGVGFAVVAVAAALAARRADAARAELGTIDRLVAYQWDPGRPSLGGVDTCLRGLATYRPDDSAERIAFVGVDAAGDRELGVWTRTAVATSGREVWFLPVARLDPDRRRRLLPHGLRLGYGLLRYRAQLRRPSIVQGHKLESTATLRLLFPVAALVSFIHSQSGALAAKGSDSRWRRLGATHGRLERAVVRSADSVVVFNPDYARDLAAINPRVHAAPTWFDPASVREVTERDPRRIVWVGRLESPKAPLCALDVFEILHERYEGWSLVMVGDGALYGEVRARVDSWPAAKRLRVDLAGRRSPDDVATVLGEGGVLLMTSVPGYEGFPRVLVEGLASGLPAVVTRGADTGSLVVDGLNGRTCGRDPRELAEAIIEVASFDRERVRESVAELNGALLVPHLLAVTRADSERSQ